MKFIRAIILLSFLSSVFLGHTQNLVPNPSFENYTACPTAPGQVDRVAPWYDPTHGTSDYFNICGTGYGHVPDFASGGYSFQFPRTGNGFVGIYAFNGFGDYNREYLQIQLASALANDSCYFVEFYCNLYSAGYSTNKLGAYLSDTAILYTGAGAPPLLNFNPQIISDTFLIDTLNWMRVSGIYRAHGGEKFLTIGNFIPFSASDTLNTGSADAYHGAYYYIDDVSITKITACDTLSTDINELQNAISFNLYPNPNNGNMALEYTIGETDHGTLQLMDYTGKQIATYMLDSNTDKLIMNCLSLDNGIYFYRVLINNKIAGYDKFIIMK